MLVQGVIQYLSRPIVAQAKEAGPSDDYEADIAH
jgi:hypothetical protein